MSTRTVTRPGYRSGWCGTSQHDRCRGTYAGASCRCSCHEPVPAPPVCGGCGRPLEEVARG